MLFSSSTPDSFSPYLDPEPWADFWEDYARRNVTAITATLCIHIILFLFFQPSFILPVVKDDDPDAIPVQIIAFGDLPKAVEPEPVIKAPPPKPALAPPPRVRPKPKPVPPPLPIEPEPISEPISEPELEIMPELESVPEIIPEPVFTPPPPEILANEMPAPETIIEPVPVPEPVMEAEPIAPPKPVIEPIAEPVTETQPSEWRPYVPPITEPKPDPIFEPEPEIIQEQPSEWREYTPPAPDIPVESAPVPGPELDQVDAPLPDLPIIETPPTILPPIEEPIDAPEIIVPERTPEDPIVTAPKILASPDAPTTQKETERAIPKSQAAPLTPLNADTPLPPKRGAGQPLTGLRAPARASLPTFDSSRPPSGSATGTPRTNPGATGWTLAKPGGTDMGPGYKGINLDIRCREAGRTHADCPEYLRKFAGRNRSGFESFRAHAPSGNGNGTGGNGTGTALTKGRAPNSGVSPWNASTGDNSVNAGGPSTTVLDDTSFSHGFQGIGGQDDTSGRVRDRFKEPDTPWEEPPVLLPAPKKDE